MNRFQCTLFFLLAASLSCLKGAFSQYSTFEEARDAANKVPRMYRAIEPSWGLIVADKQKRVRMANTEQSDQHGPFAQNMRGKNFSVAIQPIFIENNEIPLYTIADAWFAVHGLNLNASEVWNMEPLQAPEGEERLRLDLRTEFDGHQITVVAVVARRGDVGVVLNFWKDHAEPFRDLPKASDILGLYPAVKKSTVTGLPLSAAIDVQSTMINQVGLSLYNQGNMVWAIDLFRRAHELNKYDKTFFDNTLQALFMAGDHSGMVSFIEQGPSLFQKQPDVIQMLTSGLSAQGKNTEAAEYLKKTIDGGLKDDDLVINYMNVLFELDDYTAVRDIGIEALEWGSVNPTISVNLGWAYFYLEDLEKARATFLALGPLLKTNPDAAYGWMELLIEDGDFEACRDFGLEVYDTTGDMSALSYAVRSIIELGDFAMAEEKVAEGLARNPADANFLKWDEYVKSLKGTGVSREVSTPIDSVVLPEAAKERHIQLTANLPVVPDELLQSIEDKGAVYENVETIAEWKPGESYTETTRLKAKINAKSAVESFNQFTFRFNPFSESIFVNKIRVLDEQGNVIATENREKFIVRHENSSGYAAEDRVLIVPIPSIRKGRTLEFEYTRRRAGSEVKFPFTKYYFDGTFPVLESQYILIGDSSGLDVRVLGDLALTEGDGWKSWSAFQMKGLPSEDNLPTPYEHEPVLKISEQHDSWDVIIAEYRSDIEHALEEGNAEVEAWVEAQVEAYDGFGGKVAAVLDGIRDNFNYQGYLFGERAQIPNVIPDILENGYGDCKDLSLLLHRALSTIGVKSHLALVNTRGTVVPGMPSMDQFDHMIVFCPELGSEGRFLDPTNYFAVGDSDPTGLQGHECLVLDWEDIRFEKIAEAAPREAPIYAMREVMVEENGDLLVNEKITLRGRAAENMRSWLSGLTPKERVDVMQNWMNHNKLALQITELDFEHIDEFEGPVVMDVSVEFEGEAFFPDQTNHIRLPVVTETLFVGVPQVQNRVYPYRRSLPSIVTIDTELKVPDRWMARVLQEDHAVEGAADYDIGMSIDWTDGETSFTGTTLIAVGNPVVGGGSEFEAYKDQLKQVLRSVGPRISLIPNAQSRSADSNVPAASAF